jgi:hypothetical protein
MSDSMLMGSPFLFDKAIRERSHTPPLSKHVENRICCSSRLSHNVKFIEELSLINFARLCFF